MRISDWSSDVCSSDLVRYGRLFGDEPGFAAPRAVLADEIHLYSHVHGAQVGYTLRRLAARAETNGDGATPMLAIGMSATLGDPADVWRRLVGSDEDLLPVPAANEKTSNPRVRASFHFIQPEVESTCENIAGPYTTTPHLICLSTVTRRRP